MELKACPFCGGEAEWDSEGRKDTDYVMCMKCRVRTKYYPYVTEAISAWNTRKGKTLNSGDKIQASALKPFEDLAGEWEKIVGYLPDMEGEDNILKSCASELRKLIAQTKEKE